MEHLKDLQGFGQDCIKVGEISCRETLRASAIRRKRGGPWLETAALPLFHADFYREE